MKEHEILTTHLRIKDMDIAPVKKLCKKIECSDRVYHGGSVYMGV